MFNVETTHVDRPAAWCVVERVWGFVESIPVTEQWGLVLEFANQIFANDSDANTCGPDILLGTCVDNTELAPVNGA